MADTTIPAVNFKLTLEERVAAMAGPPAYIRRRRNIEDLVDELARVAVAIAGATSSRERRSQEKHAAKLLERMHALIDAHNRYYPTEANLPMDVRTGEIVERGGVPWRPMLKPTMDEILAGARAAS